MKEVGGLLRATESFSLMTFHFDLELPLEIRYTAFTVNELLESRDAKNTVSQI
jgi:hypothetical protein